MASPWEVDSTQVTFWSRGSSQTVQCIANRDQKTQGKGKRRRKGARKKPRKKKGGRNKTEEDTTSLMVLKGECEGQSRQ